MGIFDSLKDTVGSLKAGLDAAREAEVAQAGAAQSAQVAQAAQAQPERDAPMVILNPTPQNQIDAGAQRGVVTTTDFDPVEESGFVLRMPVNVYVRARLAGGELGPDTKVRIWTSSTVAKKLRLGTEIPIEMDAATGIPTKIDTKAMVAELK